MNQTLYHCSKRQSEKNKWLVLWAVRSRNLHWHKDKELLSMQWKSFDFWGLNLVPFPKNVNQDYFSFWVVDGFAQWFTANTSPSRDCSNATLIPPCIQAASQAVLFPRKIPPQWQWCIHKWPCNAIGVFRVFLVFTARGLLSVLSGPWEKKVLYDLLLRVGKCTISALHTHNPEKFPSASLSTISPRKHRGGNL